MTNEYIPLTKDELKEAEQEWSTCSDKDRKLFMQDLLKVIQIVASLTEDIQLIKPVPAEMRELIKNEYKAYSTEDLYTILDNLDFTIEAAEDALSDKLIKGE